MKIFIALSLLAALVLSGCAKEEKEPEKSMEQIRKEQGEPVRIVNVQPAVFEEYITAPSTLSGYMEMIKRSYFGDKVIGVKAKVGSYVEEGQVVIVFPTDNPTIQYEQAKAGYENAKKNYERMKSLYDSGDIAKVRLDEVETGYIVAKRNFESIKQMIEIESPISGVIVDLFVKEGEDVGSGKPLFKVAQINRMIAKLWVTSEEQAQLRIGMKAEAKWNGDTYFGKVTEIAEAMDPQRKAFGVEVVFPNRAKELKSGATVDVSIRTLLKENAIVAPKKVVKKDEKGDYIFLEKMGQAVKRYVTTGLVNSKTIEIIEGLNPDDKLITEGYAFLEDGSKVKVVE